MQAGTALFLDSLAHVADESLSLPTALPGWSGREVVAHVAANAAALGNLVRWAATGVETPMYSSPEQRAADIAAGAQQPPAVLRAWAARTAADLDATVTALSADQWRAQVRTAQGRVVPASEIPWMRAREVMIHTVDLDPARAFDELPEAFLMALIDDIIGRRNVMTGHPALRIELPDGTVWTIAGDGDESTVRGSTAGAAAFLAGRTAGGVRPAEGSLPAIPAWL